MTPRVVQLTERRTREVRLPPGEIAFLLGHARHLVDVVPAFRRGIYRLTPREHIGWFDTPSRRYAIRPKIPWPNVWMLLGLPSASPPNAPGDPDAELLNGLARELVERLREVTRIGLVPGYSERETTGEFIRGKLRIADQIRDVAARAFPDRFHVTESVLDLDTPWNRIPRAVAAQLLHQPDLAATTRTQLSDALFALESVPVVPPTAADFTTAEAEPRATHYRPLLAVCRLLHDGLAAARPGSSGRGAFLIDLSRAFERYLTAGLTAALATQAGWVVEAQPQFPVGSTTLEPDILIRRRGQPWAVLDAKWKAPGSAPDAGDLHQVLAYAAVTGAKRVGLVYPGSRLARRTFVVPGRDIGVSLIQLRVIGTNEECGAALRHLARVVRRGRKA